MLLKRFGLLVLVLFPFSRSFSQDSDDWEAVFDLLTSDNGWNLTSVVEINEGKPPRETLSDLSGCVRSENLYLFRDYSYERRASEKDCANGGMLKGTWEVSKNEIGLPIWLRLQDGSNPSNSKEFAVVSISDEYKTIMLIDKLKDLPVGKKTVLVYQQNENSVAEKNSLQPIEQWFFQIKKTENGSAEESLETSASLNGLGILPYKSPQQNDFESYLIQYVSGNASGETLLLDIDNTGRTPRLTIIAVNGETLTDITETTAFSSAKNQAALLKSGFEYVNKQYFDGKLRYPVAKPLLVYSLPAENFITGNPEFFVSIQVQVKDESGKTVADSRVFGEVRFAGNSFTFSYLE